MPSLRKLVKPTDWETIRSEVLAFAARAMDDPAIPAKVMKNLAVQLPGQRGWLVAEDAALNPCPTASLVSCVCSRILNISFLYVFFIEGPFELLMDYC